jgi:hypothetical protein
MYHEVLLRSGILERVLGFLLASERAHIRLLGDTFSKRIRHWTLATYRASLAFVLMDPFILTAEKIEWMHANFFASSPTNNPLVSWELFLRCRHGREHYGSDGHQLCDCVLSPPAPSEAAFDDFVQIVNDFMAARTQLDFTLPCF